MTECGRLPGPGMPVMSVGEFGALVRREGRKRSAMTTCITCWETAARHQVVSWAADPVGVMGREVGWARTWAPGVVRDDPAARLFETELRAIAELISRHADEFAGLVAGIAAAPSLGDRRREKRKASWLSS
jgi:hypothetical protein